MDDPLIICEIRISHCVKASLAKQVLTRAQATNRDARPSVHLWRWPWPNQARDTRAPPRVRIALGNLALVPSGEEPATQRAWYWTELQPTGRVLAFGLCFGRSMGLDVQLGAVWVL